MTDLILYLLYGMAAFAVGLLEYRIILDCGETPPQSNTGNLFSDNA